MRELNTNEVKSVNGGNPALGLLRSSIIGGLTYEGATLIWNEAQVPSGRTSGGGQMKRNNGKSKTKSAN